MVQCSEHDTGCRHQQPKMYSTLIGTFLHYQLPSDQMVRLEYGRIQPGLPVRQTIKQMNRESVLRSETRQGQTGGSKALAVFVAPRCCFGLLVWDFVTMGAPSSDTSGHLVEVFLLIFFW